MGERLMISSFALLKLQNGTLSEPANQATSLWDLRPKQSSVQVPAGLSNNLLDSEWKTAHPFPRVPFSSARNRFNMLGRAPVHPSTEFSKLTGQTDHSDNSVAGAHSSLCSLAPLISPWPWPHSNKNLGPTYSFPGTLNGHHSSFLAPGQPVVLRRWL